MNEEWKDKWVKALRSGEYQQGKELLCDDKNNFCCLGVLTDLVIKETKEFGWDEDHRNMEFLPDSIRKKVDMKTREGHFVVPVLYAQDQGILEDDSFLYEDGEVPDITNTNTDVKLWELNDQYMFSFSKIADIIEAHWEKL